MNRRNFLRSLLFAPAIIRTPGLLMPIRVLRPSQLELDYQALLVAWRRQPAPFCFMTPHWEWNGPTPPDFRAMADNLNLAADMMA
jgi:hypothetical protein